MDSGEGDDTSPTRTWLQPGAGMAEIAQLAGVSSMTVSRVVNGKPGVGEKTRRRVWQLIEERGFRPNVTARTLKTGRAHTIGVICLSTTLTGPTAVLFGVESSARRAGYSVSIVTLDGLDERSLADAMSQLVRVPVAAVVVISPIRIDDAALRGIIGGVPVVAIWAPREAAVAVAAMDHVNAARVATRHLLDLGHRTVHHISGPAGWTGTEQRIDGWRSALQEAGAEEPAIEEGDWSASSGARAMRTILRRSPDATAVFAANDQMALGVISACYEERLAVPERVSVVGYDDLPDAEFYSPPLTTVRQDFALIAARAVEMALAQVEGGDPPSTELVDLPLIVRSSTAPAPQRT